MGATQASKIQKELAPLIIEGLKSSPKFFPSLLLWDDKGAAIYERIMRSRDYYLTHTEAELIRANADSIVEAIPSGSVILELGSGYLTPSLIFLPHETSFSHDIDLSPKHSSSLMLWPGSGNT